MFLMIKIVLRTTFKLVLLLCYFSLILKAAAETEELISEDEFLTDIPMVLSATRLSQPANETPNSVTVIDKKTIRASGFKEIPDLFRLVPGMVVSVETGNRSSVSYHGINDEFSRRMQVLIDGRSVYDPLFSGPDWSDITIDIDDIERIEVIRGPNSAIYGSNSFLGVINIITSDPSEQTGLNVRLREGSNGIREAVFKTGLQQDRFSGRATFGIREEDEGVIIDHFDGKSSPFINIKSSYQLDQNDSLYFNAGWIGGERGEGHVTPPVTDDPVRFRRDKAHFQQLSWQHVFDNGNEFKLQGFHNYRKFRDRFATLPIDLTAFGITSFFDPISGLSLDEEQLENFQLELDESGTAQRFDLEGQYTWTLNDQMRGVTGFGLRRDRVRSLNLFDTNDWQEKDLRRGFGHLEWRFKEDWLLNTGVMVEHNSISGTDVTPRIALNHHLDNGHTVRFGISTATRTPFATEEKGDLSLKIGEVTVSQDFLASGGLDSEFITAYDIGYLGSGCSDSCSWDVRLFYEDIDDAIPVIEKPFDDPIDGIIRDFENLDDLSIKGAEFQYKHDFSEQTNLLLNYSYIDIDSTNNVPRYQFELSTPKHIASGLISHHFSNDWRASLVGYYKDETVSLGSGRSLGEGAKAYKRVDFNLAKEFEFSGNMFEASVHVQNIFNDQLNEFIPGHFLDRRIYFTLRFSSN